MLTSHTDRNIQNFTEFRVIIIKTRDSQIDCPNYNRGNVESIVPLNNILFLQLLLFSACRDSHSNLEVKVTAVVTNNYNCVVMEGKADAEDD